MTEVEKLILRNQAHIMRALTDVVRRKDIFDDLLLSADATVDKIEKAEKAQARFAATDGFM